jgi:hypothetical protein
MINFQMAYIRQKGKNESDGSTLVGVFYTYLDAAIQRQKVSVYSDRQSMNITPFNDDADGIKERNWLSQMAKPVHGKQTVYFSKFTIF